MQLSLIEVPMEPQPLKALDALALVNLCSHDVEEQAEQLRHWDQTYVQLSPGCFEGRLVETWFGDIQFFRETTNQVIHEAGRSWPGSRTFCVPLSMRGSSYFRGIEWPADTCATMGGDVDFELRTAVELDVVAVSFRAERLAEAAQEHDLDPIDFERWLSGCGTARLPPASVAALRRMLLDIAMLVETRSALLNSKAVRSSMEGAIYEAFLQLMADASDLRVSQASYLPRRQLVKRAIEFVAEHPDDLVTVGDLCRLLRVSRRTLQQYFDEVLHISPLQYLRAFRLNKVRTLIRSAGGVLRVQDAAAQWGFWHLSQFASDYRRLFGELPSQTSAQARGGA
jgi:AraC family ethanolamine operon transcriptional activator